MNLTGIFIPLSRSSFGILLSSSSRENTHLRNPLKNALYYQNKQKFLCLFSSSSFFTQIEEKCKIREAWQVIFKGITKLYQVHTFYCSSCRRIEVTQMCCCLILEYIQCKDGWYIFFKFKEKYFCGGLLFHLWESSGSKVIEDKKSHTLHSWGQ